MPIISVINYKGGVGKTTVTANIGAELARRGQRVLLIDMDPQASLTFSFIKPDVWEAEFRRDGTIKKWFDSFLLDEPFELESLVVEPKRAAEVLRSRAASGSLSLIPSDLGLINVDLDLATSLGGASEKLNSINYLRVHQRLAKGLKHPRFDEFDYVLIDCPPNFNIVTKTAIVASDTVLVPAKPDYLSTLGIHYLQKSLDDLVDQYNHHLTVLGWSDPIAPSVIGVVFTMVQFLNSQPIAVQRDYIRRTEELGIPVFSNYVRENKTLMGAAPEGEVPLALDTYAATRQIRDELRSIVDEFETRIAGGRR